MDRKEQLLRGIDKSMQGVEISPFYNPIASRADGWKTVIASNSDTDAQRREARDNSSLSVRESEALIESVDVIWSGNSLSEACLKINPQGYDYLILSHVLEHIPDFLGFMQNVERLLKPEGVLSMAVPDLRVEFDFFRNPSDTAEVLRAYREKRQRNTPETMFRYYSHWAEVDGIGCWTRSNTGIPKLNGSLVMGYQRMLEQEVELRDGDWPYRDAHAWTFVPASLKLIMYELYQLELTRLYVSMIEVNEGSEFIVQLRKRQHVMPFGRDSEETQKDKRQSLMREIIQELSTRPI